VLEGDSTWRLARSLVAYGRRRVDRMGEVKRLEGDEFLIRAEPRQRVGLDGEIKGRTPVRITLAPRALRVMAAREGDLPPA
jgi:diacylglycerol kinase family enzyme